MDNAHVFGFCGKAGCGKGTCSELVKQIREEQFFLGKATVEIFPMAQALKDIATDHFGWDGKKDEKGRRLLQVLGTECGRMYGGENFWVNKWQQSVDRWLKYTDFDWCRPDKPIVICDDVRFDNEAQHIKDIGGKIIHISGRAYDMGENNNHASEAGISEDLVDYNIYNKHDMDVLHSVVFEILEHEGIV
jgi:hypothetical protein